MRVELYTRAGCHLCDEARVVLDAVGRERPFELVVRDVDSDPALAARYGNDVPVVLVAGRAAFRHRLDPRELVLALEGR